MAHYLVVHSPSNREVESVRPPTRLRELAEASKSKDTSARWLKTWTPDIHDDRIFSLWDADSADQVRAALEDFGFLDDMDATPLRVREWGPEDVLTAPSSSLPTLHGAPCVPVLKSKRATRSVALFATSLLSRTVPMPETHAVGQRVRRIDGPPKLTGQERFTGDLRVPGLLIARPVTSPYAHARIRSIDASRALEIPGVFRVLSSDDLPIARDSAGAPVKAPIASGEAVYAGQFVALVLAESDAAAQDGVAAVEVDFEPLPVITTLDEALDRTLPHIRETRQQANDEEAAMHNADAAIQAEENDELVGPNVSNSVHFSRGDVATGFAAADEIVDFTVESLTVHQGYLEPQACLVDIEPLGDLTVYTSTQAAFYCRTRVAQTVNLPTQRINVVPMPVGGGFGGKFVLIEPMVAAAALAVGRPVLLHYSRMDDFLARQSGA